MRWYLRGRIGKHLGWVLPLNGTRAMSHTPRQHARWADASGLQKFAVVFFTASIGLLCLVCAFVR